MHRSPGRSYDAGGGRRYMHAMWLLQVEAGPCRLDVPMMSGLGGNLVLFLPNGLIAIRFADADNYEPSPMVRAAELVRPACR